MLAGGKRTCTLVVFTMVIFEGYLYVMNFRFECRVLEKPNFFFSIL